MLKFGIFPIYFIFDLINSGFNIIKLIEKFIENYRINNYLKNLNDFDINNNNNNNEILCNICLVEIFRGKKIFCGHIFHLKCLK